MMASRTSPQGSGNSLFIFHFFFLIIEGATACLFHLPLQAFVATITELKARAGNFFVNSHK